MNKMENVADIYPLTPAQQGILYHTLRAPESQVYFEQIRATLDGPLHVDKLRAAWDNIVARHPVLRTAFLWDGLDQPLQVVRQQVDIPWQVHDWRSESGDVGEKLDKLAAANRQQGFDLAQAPLLRLVLVQLADERHHLIWNFHHLLTDGWSTHQVFKEVFTVYEALVAGKRPFLPTVPPFRNYVAWLKKQNLTVAEAYWRRELAGFAAPTPLHVDRHTPDDRVAYAEADAYLTAAQTAALKALAQQHRLTLNTIVQGAWALLLSRYSGESDVVFGATVSGRPAALPGVEQMVGMFINTLPLRVQVETDQPLIDWLQRLQEQQLEMRQHEHSPLVKVQQWSDVPGGQSLFDTIVVFENYPAPTDDDARTLYIRNVIYREQSNYPLALLVVPDERLRLLSIFNSHRFAPETVQRLLGHLATLLAAMPTQPQGALADLPLLTPAERTQIFEKWNDTAVPLPTNQTVLDLIEGHAQTTPDVPAVIFGDEQLTYAELNGRADQLAVRLQNQGVAPGDLVALAVPRSLEMAVGIVGILKTGAAYVPIDPAYPAERQQQIVADAKPTATLTIDDLRFTIDKESPIANRQSKIVNPDDLAYVIYTSGSTGTPKGVMVTHRNLLASTLARFDYYDTPAERYLLLSSFAFDSSVAGIFWTLAQGGALVLPAPDDEKDVAKVAAIIARNRVTHTLALPSLYKLLLTYAAPDALDSLRAVIVAGEACPPDLSATHYGRLPHTALYNEYGPTEATVWCSVYRLPADGRADGPVPIGKPIANSQLLVLDANYQPVPVGVPGELYVGGAGVTPGYFNQPERTKERFIDLRLKIEDLSFSHQSSIINHNFYRTGDLVKWLPDGNLAFLGRVDNQVKIRGYRIEPGEIEAVLAQHPAVSETAVSVWERDNDKRLVAYVISNGTAPSADDLKAYLGRQLPDYMVPPHFMLLPDLPRMPNGKIDRQNLPEPDVTMARERPFTPAQTDTEKKLADIWADVLRLPQVGIHDKFFELGGDSILSIQAVARARQAGLALTPRQLFNEQTIARLAALAEQNDAATTAVAAASGPFPLTPIQRWLVAQNLANPAQWNQAVWLEVASEVNIEHLITGLNALLSHHPMLRARFQQDGDGWQQEIAVDTPPLLLRRISLADQTPAAQDTALQTSAAELHASLHLANGPLVAAALFDLGTNRPPRLFIVAHHLVVDAVSWQLLTANLASAYAQAAAGQPIDLPAAPTTFSQWAQALPTVATNAHTQQQLAFWREMTAVSTPLPFATDAPNTEGDAGYVTVSLDADHTAALLRAANDAYHTRPDDLLLTAFVQTMAGWTQQPSLLLSLERHGREEIAANLDVSQTVGWFTSLFPITLSLANAAPNDPGASIRAVKEQLRRIPQNGVGYGLLRYLGDATTQAQLANRPQPQILFNYLGQMDSAAPASAPFRPLAADIGPAYGHDNERAHLLDMNARVQNGRLHTTWQYPTTMLPADDMRQVAQHYLDELSRLIDHCTGADGGQHTPSDFPLSNLEQDELDSISALLAELE